MLQVRQNNWSDTELFQVLKHLGVTEKQKTEKIFTGATVSTVATWL